MMGYSCSSFDTLKKSRWYCNVQQTSLVGKDQGQKMEVMKPSQNKRSSFKVTSTHCQFETMILILQNSVITIFWCFMKTESLTAILSVCFPCSVWCIWTSETRTTTTVSWFSLFALATNDLIFVNFPLFICSQLVTYLLPKPATGKIFKQLGQSRPTAGKAQTGLLGLLLRYRGPNWLHGTAW